nr:phosphoribosylformylglycinamidine synthase subunit PurS [Croceicoccus pelagius]
MLAGAAQSRHRRTTNPKSAISKGPSMKVNVHVSLKSGVLDPQGRAIHHALEGLGFSGVNDVRAGRLIALDVADDTSDEALDEMCRKLLANMVIENYRIEKVG